MKLVENSKAYATKSLILESARSLFYEKGYKKTSVTDIAKSAYVAKGTFYLYFQDKMDLMDHLVVEFVTRFDHVIKKLQSELDIPGQGLATLIEGAVSDLFDVCFEYRCCFVFFHDKETADLMVSSNHLNTFNERNVAGLKTILQKGIDRGEVRKLNPSLYAEMIYVLIHGFVEQCLLQRKDLAYIQLAKLELATSINKMIESDLSR